MASRNSKGERERQIERRDVGSSVIASLYKVRENLSLESANLGSVYEAWDADEARE